MSDMKKTTYSKLYERRIKLIKAEALLSGVSSLTLLDGVKLEGGGVLELVFEVNTKKIKVIVKS